MCDCGGYEHSYSPYPPTRSLPVQVEDELGIPLPYENAENDSPGKRWLPNLQLTAREQPTLDTGLLLNAHHITAAMYLLRMKVVELEMAVGNMDYQQRLQENLLENTFMTNDLAIQVVHIPNHWQLIVRRERDIYFYCSLDREITPEIVRVLNHSMGKKQGDIISIRQEQCQLQRLRCRLWITRHCYGCQRC